MIKNILRKIKNKFFPKNQIEILEFFDSQTCCAKKDEVLNKKMIDNFFESQVWKEHTDEKCDKLKDVSRTEYKTRSLN